MMPSAQPAGGAAEDPIGGDCGAHKADRGWRGVPADEDTVAAPHRGRHRPGRQHRAGGFPPLMTLLMHVVMCGLLCFLHLSRHLH